MFKIVLFLTFAVLCVVHTQSDDGCSHSRSYTRVKRGKYHPGPPVRFYNRPPITIPIKGPFSYTPPPFMPDDEPPYPGSRPYKVSKRPTSDGLGDNDINNLVKHLTKQDLDKIIEFANEKDKYSETTKDFFNEVSRPHKRENQVRPTYTKDIYKGNIEQNYQEEKPYEVEFMKHLNYVTEATPTNYAPQDDRRNSFQIDSKPNKVTFYSPQSDQRIREPIETEGSFTSPSFTNPQELNPYQVPSNSEFSETAEEEKLPPPVNMREEDFVVSYTNNIPTIIGADSSAYKTENFGDLPLMNYNSKLHTVSSYHVPHYTVTQPKSKLQSPPASSQSSFSSSQSYSSSSSLLKQSPAAAAIKAPLYEPAPPASAAREQSDAHLKATKIWSHRSKGAAYTLHDDGTLTPEWPRPPKNYG